MPKEIRDLGEKRNIEVIESFVDLRGKKLADVGCGGMALSLLLAEKADHVLAIDPDSVQAQTNRAANLPSNLEFREGSGDKLPTTNDSLDGVFFAYSLHHIPGSLHPAVFDEVQRVLKPDGFLYVIEPIDGAWNQVMRTFHDEEEVRALAQKSLLELAVPRFKSSIEVTYHGFSQFESFDDFADFFCAKAFNTSYSAEDARAPAVKEAFEKYGTPDYRFESPKQVMFLNGLN